MNCDFIRMLPVSNSNLVCETCGHLYDPYFRVCTCYPPNSVEVHEDANKLPIRHVMPYQEYAKRFKQ